MLQSQRMMEVHAGTSQTRYNKKSISMLANQNIMNGGNTNGKNECVGICIGYICSGRVAFLRHVEIKRSGIFPIKGT